MAAAVQAQAVDVPYVPTPWNVVDAMLKIASVGGADYLIDLGSGDGRIVIAAAKRYGTRGLGVDLDSGLVGTAQREARRQGVGDKVAFRAENLFITDISQATVITMYLWQPVNEKLRPQLLTLRPGTRIVSHDFDLGDWKPDDQLTLPVPDKSYGPPSSNIYLWHVPADASGIWKWRLTLGGAPRDYELALEQTFQMLEGSPRVAGNGARLTGGRMRGDEISFVLTADIDGREVRHVFSGRVTGDAIAGSVKIAEGAPLTWNAARMARGKRHVGDAVAPGAALAGAGMFHYR